MAKWIEDPQGRLEVEKVTEELKLPVWKANYKGKFREFWNECWEKIEDSFLKLKKSNEGKEPAITTKETAFNKPFGVSEDTVLEGNKFTQMTGKDYGGILNIAGQKEAGKAYWDNNTKKLYICKNNNSDISPNVNNYIPFDSNSLLEKLENLKRKTKMLLYNGGSIIPNNSISAPLEEWDYFTFGIGAGVNNGKDRMAFLVRNSVQYNGDIIRFQGIELEYNSRNKTLRVINNGGNLYYIEQYSCLT